MDIERYRGVIPAFYACYDEAGQVSVERTRRLARHLVNKGVKGLYVGGSSGECIYLEKEERMAILEAVMAEVKGECTIFALVSCNNTHESCQLAAHAESLGVDAIASIPPIYFHLPDHAIAAYWNAISSAAPHTDFIIYNIPQLAGVALSVPLLREMRKNPRVIGVKNSSMPTQDSQIFKAEGGENFVVFNGPDEQFVAGRAIGADGGIGGTYAVMPELFLAMDRLIREGRLEEARKIQYAANDIIAQLCACHGNLYAVMKKVLEKREGLLLGSVRAPLSPISEADLPQIEKCAAMIDDAVRAIGAKTQRREKNMQRRPRGFFPPAAFVCLRVRTVLCPRADLARFTGMLQSAHRQRDFVLTLHRNAGVSSLHSPAGWRRSLGCANPVQRGGKLLRRHFPQCEL